MVMNIVDAINALINECVVADGMYAEPCHKVICDDTEYKSYAVPISQATSYESVITDILREYKELASNTSRDSVSDLLFDLICKAKKDCSFIDKNQMQTEIVQKLTNKPLIEREVFHKIYGLTVSNELPIVAGRVRFYNYQSFTKHLFGTHDIKHTNPIDVLLSHFTEQDAIISTTIKTRDNKKARELGYKEFEAIESILRFFISFWNLKYFDIGIIHLQKSDFDEHIILHDDSMSFEMNLVGKRNALDFDDFQSRFVKHDFSPVGLIEKFCKQNKNQMENRLLMAIELLGRAVYDLGKPISFLFSMMAIEALIQLDTKNLVNQSISAQISEYCAFLLEDTRDKRIEVERMMKRLYGVRSKIAHGSSYKCTLDENKEVLYNARDLVSIFFDNHTLSSFTKFDDLRKHIQMLKYKE